MIIKVCGMKNPENIKAVAELPINLMGLIFYPKSPRYIQGLSPESLEVLPENIRRVGVFVNEEVQVVVDCIDKFGLDYVQLHGNESPEYCLNLKEFSPHVKIIKAFSIAETSDFEKTDNYENKVDYFLFDTKTPQYGGSGQKFDWSVLKDYKGNIPFFLSGGISYEDVLQIKGLEKNKMVGLDLNSKFELEPGLKNLELLHRFIKEIKS